MMLHNNIIVTTLSISCVLSLSNSWELFLLDGKGTSHNSTRIKRQIQVCALPDHPPNGKYIFIGSQGAYTPNTFVNELSIIRLTCTEPYVTRSENPQSLCFEGLWSPPLLDVEECVEPITTITGTTTTTTRTTTSLATTATATGTQLSSSENLCVLPSHPRNGEFSIDTSTGPYQYIPGANVPALAILRLSCFNSYVPEKPKPQSLCTDGVWSPLITTLGTCIHSALPNPTLDTSCLLPPHPSNGEFRILGSELYMPNTSVAEHSSIDLKCRPSYTTENKLVRALCFQGEWVPPFSGLETCSRKDALTTTTQAPTEPHTCILPDHPTNGRFKIKGTENYDYKPNSVVQQYTNIELICSEDGAESKPADAVCFDGKWLNLGTCTGNRTPTTTESSGPRSRDGCIIPSNQTHGTYKLGNDESFDTIIFTCEKGYYPLYLSHWCDNGDWNPPLFDCIRTCPPLPKSETYTATCKRNRNYVDCSKGLEGTQVIDVKCNTFFEYKTIRPIPKCKDGTWTHDIVPCVPECGKRQVPVQELIIDGKYSEKGEYPWLVGIYHNQSHICGGSIISRFYVLSAAHCFTVYNNTLEALNPIDENEYLVAAGKHYRTLYDAKDTYRQIIGVKRIYISTFYLGIIQNYREDYAILQVKEPFILSQYVQLVCVDWESNYIEDDFIENKTALVSGWGYTLEGSSPSEELKKLKVHFKSRPSCNKNFRKDFAQRYFTDDKVCAGYIGQTVCRGDSGGGLYFEHENVYYVRGIVSVSPVSKIGCSVKYYALYTDVSKYIETITQETGRLL